MSSNHSWCLCHRESSASPHSNSVALPGNAAPSVPCSLPGRGNLAAKSVAPNFESDFGDGKGNVAHKAIFRPTDALPTLLPASLTRSFSGHLITVCHQTS
jgi:hypothetical protein